MINMLCKTKGNSNPQGKPRVYFTCHPNDFDKYFDKICDDILKTHDCAIYYKKNMSESISTENIDIDIGRNNMFVIPVTLKLLKTFNPAMNQDLTYAKQKHIPILPIMMETELDEIYSETDKFGELQYLNPFSTDLTEISYQEKLKNYLDSVLVSDEIASRVRKTFDAYAFLSYRKKDRRYANELMRIIHSKPECRDIAIWFDEFLTPGESFKENINKILNDSKLFILLVTPNLLEETDGKPNFVMEEEYPVARDFGITILPAEMVETDKHELSRKFKGIPECINPQNEMFKERLVKSLPGVITTRNKNNPEHDFLIGLAYLNGIDVEKDTCRAIELMENAAKNNIFEAAEKLVDIYRNGIGVLVNLRTAMKWQECLIEILLQKYAEIPDIECEDELFWSYLQKGDISLELDDINLAEQSYLSALKLLRKSVLSGNEIISQRNEAAVYTRLGTVYEGVDLDLAMNHYKKAASIQIQICKQEPSVHSLRYLAICFQMCAGVCIVKKQLADAKIHLEHAIELLCQIDDSSESLVVRRDMAVCFEKMGKICAELGETNGAFDYFKKCLNYRTLLIESNETEQSMHDLCVSHVQLGHLYKSDFEFKLAIKHYESALDTAQKYYKEFCSLNSMQDLSTIYTALAQLFFEDGQLNKAKENAENALLMCQKALEISDKKSLYFSLSTIYEILAHIEEYEGNNTEMIAKYYHKVLKLRIDIVDENSTINEKQNLSIAYENIGSCFKKQKKNHDAVDYFQKALEIRKEIFETTGTYQAQRFLCISYDHMGDAYMQIQNYIEAVANYQKALDMRISLVKISETIDVLYELSVSYMKIGDISMEFCDLKTAEMCFVEMLHLNLKIAEKSDSIKNKRNIMIAYSNIGNVYFRKNEFSKADQCFSSAFEIGNEIDAATDTIEAKNDMITTLIRISNVAIVQKNVEKEKAVYQLIFHLRVKILEKSNIPEHWDNFALTLLEMSKIDTEKREQYIKDAVSIYEKLCAENPAIEQYKKKLSNAKMLMSEE